MLSINNQRILVMKKHKKIEVGHLFSTNGGCDAKVISYTNSKNVLIEFQDEHKHQTVTSTTHIRSGSVRNPYQPSVYGIGYIGVGNHIASVGTKGTNEYELWRRMLGRCYDDGVHERQPTYKGCSVCDEWHNFQNFADWLIGQNYYKEGYELDKDLVIKGNKVYSPNTCRFVPKKINVILNNCEASRGAYPTGVTFNKKEGKFTASMRVNGKKIHLGYFGNPDEAFNAYALEKESYVKTEAQRFKGEMDADVFAYLMSWEVDK